MRSRELQKELSETFRGRSASDIDQRCRILRDVLSDRDGHSSVPRGLAAPHLTPLDVAFHVMALIPRRPADFIEVFPRLAACTVIPHPLLGDLHTKIGLMDGCSIQDVIRAATEDPRPGWYNIEIAEDGDRAWLSYRDTASPFYIRFLFATEPAAVMAQMAKDVDESKHNGHDATADELKRLHAIAYETLDRNTRGNRFTVNAMDLFWLGYRARMSHPELRDQVEQEPVADGASGEVT